MPTYAISTPVLHLLCPPPSLKFNITVKHCRLVISAFSGCSIGAVLEIEQALYREDVVVLKVILEIST